MSISTLSKNKYNVYTDLKMNKKLELSDKKPIWILKDIENVFQELYDQYRCVVQENESLRKENERLKSETYKDEELARMKKEYERMKADYFRGFSISESEEARINRWIKQRPDVVSPGIGERFLYDFIPTSIGVIGTITDLITKEKLTFREP